MGNQPTNVAFLIRSVVPSYGGISRVTDMIVSHLSPERWKCYAIVTDDVCKESNFTCYSAIINESGLTDESISRTVTFCNSHKIKILINTEGAVYYNLPLLKALYETGDIRIVSCNHSTPLMIDSLTIFHRNLKIPLCLNRFLFLIYKTLCQKPKYISKLREIYGISDRYVVLDDSYATQFARLIAISDLSKLSVIPNPSLGSKTTDLSQKGNVVLFVGRISSEKRVDRILRIWDSFCRSHPDWRLVIVGDGPLRHSLILMAESMGLDRISFEGYCKDVRPYYRTARLLLLTSEYEGWPMTVVEAMGFGVVPIVYNSFSAIGSIINDGVSGYIVNKCGEKKIRQQFEKSMDDAIKNYTSLARGCTKSVARYGLDRIVGMWDQLLSSIY